MKSCIDVIGVRHYSNVFSDVYELSGAARLFEMSGFLGSKPVMQVEDVALKCLTMLSLAPKTLSPMFLVFVVHGRMTSL